MTYLELLSTDLGRFLRWFRLDSIVSFGSLPAFSTLPALFALIIGICFILVLVFGAHCDLINYLVTQVIIRWY